MRDVSGAEGIGLGWVGAFAPPTRRSATPGPQGPPAVASRFRNRDRDWRRGLRNRQATAGGPTAVEHLFSPPGAGAPGGAPTTRMGGGGGGGSPPGPPPPPRKRWP